MSLADKVLAVNNDLPIRTDQPIHSGKVRSVYWLNDADSAVRVAAERAMNSRLGGGCQVPIAGYAELDGDGLRLRALVASVDGRRMLRAEGRAPREQGKRLGREVAEELLGQGADGILAEVYGEHGGQDGHHG